jgi:hypothetical protein
MKKSIQSVFLAFVVLTVLMSGCAPASTPIPPTLTLVSTNTPIPTKTSIPPTAIPPTDTPAPTPTEVPWNIFKSIATEEKPIELQNISSNWQTLKLITNLKFSGAFEIKLNMESIGANGIILTYAQNGGEPWWKGTKRMEIYCEEGTLGVLLRDGTAEQMVYDNGDNRPLMPSSNGATICQITVRFDQYAKNIQIFQDNKIIFQVIPEQVGDFQGGLFPDGNILKVELSNSPKSGINSSSIKVVDFGFYIPPE